jgi:serine/threonine protein kinase
VSPSRSYQILNLVASGGTAVLYKAIQTSLERTVAIKKLHHHLTEDENFTRRFELEAKAAASLDHDNIVKIIDFGAYGDSYHMIIEFIEGQSLREILDNWRQVPVDATHAVVLQVCLGLEHAHAKGIVHRDIKPGNIMLTRSGRVKITDFGLAKLTQGTTQHTAANSILGTPLYMSPEQAFGESVDHRSDIFSLGTLLYEMLTGIQPFRDENYMGVIQNIINRNAPHPSKYNIEIPTSVQSLLGKAMNKSREARFQNAAEFRKAIEKYLGLERLNAASESLKALLQTSGETMALTQMQPARVPKLRRVRRGFVVTLIVGLVVGAGGLGYTLAPEGVERQVRNIYSRAKNIGSSERPVKTSNLSGAQILDPMSAVGQPDSLASRPTAGDNTAAVHGPTALSDSMALTPVDTTLAQSTQVPSPTETQPAAVQNQAASPAPVEPEKPAEEPKPAPVKVAKKGWLSVKVEPWAEIYVDGRYRGDSPASRIALERGAHQLECRKPKHGTYRETVNITAGEFSTRSVVLKKLTGKIALSTIAGAEVYLDGSLIGVTPLNGPIKVDVGSHLVTVKKAGYNVWNNSISVETDQLMPLKITLSPMY